MRARAGGALVALGLSCMCGRAWAAPRSAYGFGARSAALGGAVTADAGDAASLFYNPALLSLAPASQLLEIKSPMVGTFYSAPEPGADPYVKVGSRVSPGQVVCIIEAMKIMNEIESELHGVIREISVENTQPVEFGQVLYRVDPNG